MKNKNSIIDTHFIKTTPPGDKQQSTMNKKTIYLSGPITGMPENNFREFALVEERLNAMGYNVINPHVICQNVNPKLFKNEEEYWQHCMRLCVAEMAAFADTVLTLKGWEDSRGAKEEVGIARELGFITVEHIVAFLAKHETHVN